MFAAADQQLGQQEKGSESGAFRGGVAHRKKKHLGRGLGRAISSLKGYLLLLARGNAS